MSEQLEQLGFTCAACGKQFQWKPELAGKLVKCKCSASVTVPAQAGGVAQPNAATGQAAKGSSATAGAPGAPSEMQGVTPARAVRKASSAPGIAGAARAGEVPPRAAPAEAGARRQAADAPARSAKPAGAVSLPPPISKKPAAAPAAEADGDLDGLFELAADAERAAPGAADAVPRCPCCRTDLPIGAVLCTGCGTDLRTGRKLAPKAAAIAPGGAVAALAAGAGAAAAPLPWGVRRRAPQDIGAARGFTTENVYFEGGRFRSLYLPLILIFVGLGLSMLHATFLGKQAGEALTAPLMLMITLGMIVIDAVLLFMALMLAVRLFDMGFGAVGPALLKIVAIAMGPAAVGGIIGHLAGGGMGGFFVASIVSMVLYYTLISVLFDLDLSEVITLVTLIWLIENMVKPFIIIALFLSATGGMPGAGSDLDDGSGIPTSGYEVLGDREEEEPYAPDDDVYDSYDDEMEYGEEGMPPQPHAPAATEGAVTPGTNSSGATPVLPTMPDDEDDAAEYDAE